MNKKLLIPILGVTALVGGALSGMVGFANAQTASTAATTTQTPSNSTQTGTHMHAPLGGDGNIASINGSTIVMTEEADEGGSYTIDASGVTLPTGLKVGDKIFVKGTVTGNSVVATEVSLGHSGGHKAEPKDAQGNDIETNDDATSAQ